MHLIFRVLTTQSQTLILDTWFALSELKPDKYGLCWQNRRLQDGPGLGLRGRAARQAWAYAQRNCWGRALVGMMGLGGRVGASWSLLALNC